MEKASTEAMTLNVIAHIHTAFPTKFGIPRQSGLVDMDSSQTEAQ